MYLKSTFHGLLWIFNLNCYCLFPIIVFRVGFLLFTTVENNEQMLNDIMGIKYWWFKISSDTDYDSTIFDSMINTLTSDSTNSTAGENHEPDSLSSPSVLTSPSPSTSGTAFHDTIFF